MNFDLTRATILALIQGLTEFLPVSSSAHLILPSQLFGWEDQGLAFDLAVHLGSLLAVVAYFREDLKQLTLDMLRGTRLFSGADKGISGWKLAVATLPVVVAGFILKDVIATSLRDARVIVVTTLVFGVLLWFADQRGRLNAGRQLSWTSAMVIGLAQVLALVPGTSRSGITMTAAMFCGLGREDASRFSFLLSIPVIAGAALLMLVDLLQVNDVNWAELAYGLILSAITAYLCIHFFLRRINESGFLPYVIYRLGLGLVLLLVLF